MDQDNKLDIVSSTIQLPDSRSDIDQPSDLRLIRIITNIPVPAQLKWGTYMGSNYNGIFEKNQTIDLV